MHGGGGGQIAVQNLKVSSTAVQWGWGVRLQSRIWSKTAVKILKHNCRPSSPGIRRWAAEADAKLQYHEISVPRRISVCSTGWPLVYILFLYVNVPRITGLRGGGMVLLTWGLWWCCRSGECGAVVVLVLLGEACTVRGVTVPCWRRWCGERVAMPGNCDELPGNCGYGWLPGRNGLVKLLLLLLLTTTRTKKEIVNFVTVIWLR